MAVSGKINGHLSEATPKLVGGPGLLMRLDETAHASYVFRLGLFKTACASTNIRAGLKRMALNSSPNPSHVLSTNS